MALRDDAVFVAGEITAVVDLAPGDAEHPVDVTTGGEVMHDALYLTRLDPEGTLLWASAYPGARSIGGELRLRADDEGPVYLAGRFTRPTDFDPGPGQDIRDPGDVYGGFITRLEDDGTYGWTRVWQQDAPYDGEPFFELHPDGSLVMATAKTVEVLDRTTGEPTSSFELGEGGKVAGLVVRDDGVVVLARTYQPTTEGSIPGAIEAYSVGGELQWRYVTEVQDPGGLALVGDDVVMFGQFHTLADRPKVFGEGESEGHLSHGSKDVYVTRLDAAGQWVSTATWGSLGEDVLTAVAEGPEGTLFAVGTFVKTLHRTDGSEAFLAQEKDAFVIQIDRAGDTVGLRTWGGRGDDNALGVTWSPTAGLAVAGSFGRELDVSSTTEPTVHVAVGLGDALVLGFGPGRDTDEGACRPPAETCDSRTSSKLTGTNLPRDFDECLERSGGDGLVGADGNRTCWFQVPESAEPETFAQCRDAGGGIIELEPGQACKIVYPQCGAPCFGNFCD